MILYSPQFPMTTKNNILFGNNISLEITNYIYSIHTRHILLIIRHIFQKWRNVRRLFHINPLWRIPRLQLGAAEYNVQGSGDYQHYSCYEEHNRPLFNALLQLYGKEKEIRQLVQSQQNCSRTEIICQRSTHHLISRCSRCYLSDIPR